MKVKKFQADNMQKAMAMVREELGREAVLISSKRVDGKMEVLAASGYELEQVKGCRGTSRGRINVQARSLQECQAA